MNIEEIRDYCLSKPGTEESFPFDETTLVFKVGGKMFALLSLDEANMNLKCDPEEAVRLRERYSFVVAGYHMNKKHWNTILDCTQPPAHLVRRWIDQSYQRVFEKLPRKIRDTIPENL